MNRVCITVLVLALVCVASAVAAYHLEDEIEADEYDGLDIHDREPTVSSHYPSHHHATINPMARYRPIRPMRTLTTHNLSTVFMRALDTKNAMLLMMITDSKTLIAYNSDLPAGGLYKGRRGLMELGEACTKSVRMINSSYKIVNVDEDRSTATVVRTFTGVAVKTNVKFTARTMFVIKFSLMRVACIDIVDLDYDTMVSALSSNAEKALAHLGEEWFAHGPLGESTQGLVADNVTVTFGAVWPKTLFTIKGKQNIANEIRNNKKSDACKLLECLKNHTEESLVLHADENRVVSINFAGNLLKARKYIDRHSDGTILHGLTRIGHKHGNLAVYFALHEFDNEGKLVRVFIHLARPLTLLDRVHLRNAHNITITIDEHTHAHK